MLKLPDVGTAPTPQYLLCLWDNTAHVIKTLGMMEIKPLDQMMIYMFQHVPNLFQEAMYGINGCRTLAAGIRRTYMSKSDSWYKAGLVAKGYTQVQGIEYEETFSPVARYNSIQYLLAHTALLDWEIEAMDIKLAYLREVLKEEIYIEQPEGFIAKGNEDKVCKLVCSLYGLKQAGWVWNRTFAITIKRKLGFTTIHSDVGVYILCHQQGRSTKIVLILYVNDLLLLGKDQSEIADIKCQLGDLYHMKDLGPASSYLGIQIIRNCKSRSICIDQQAYIKNAIKRFGLQDASNTQTLLPAALHLEKYEGKATTGTKTLFQQMIRTLIYAAIGTRPNITFAATQLSWYNNNPSDSHIKYAKHVLRYLQGIKDSTYNMMEVQILD